MPPRVFPSSGPSVINFQLMTVIPFIKMNDKIMRSISTTDKLSNLKTPNAMACLRDLILSNFLVFFILFLMILSSCGNKFHSEVDDHGQQEQDAAQCKQGFIM